MTEIEQVVDIVTNVGFPIAVSIYLLYERDRRTKELTEAIRDLTEYVRSLKG